MPAESEGRAIDPFEFEGVEVLEARLARSDGRLGRGPLAPGDHFLVDSHAVFAFLPISL